MRASARQWTEGRGLLGSLTFSAETVKEGLVHGLGPEEPAEGRKAPPLKMLAGVCAAGAVLAARGGPVGALAGVAAAASGVVLGAAAAAERARL